MEYIQGTSRDQLVIFQSHLDEIICKDAPVRFIDEYIESLDIEEIGFQIPKLNTGRPPFDPRLLLKIYVYCYFEKIRSSRKIEKECSRNQELIWLTCNLIPDFKTIADFRKNNKDGLTGVFKSFLLFCKELDLLSLDVTAVDGTKMRGQNGLNEVYNRKTIDSVEAKIEEKIEKYLKELDENDNQDSDELKLDQKKVTNLLGRLENLQKRKKKVGEIKKKFINDPNLETYFATDPDARFQSDKGKVRPGYNPQISIESKNNLIIVNEVTNQSNDLKQVTPMKKKIREIKEILDINQKTKVLFDAGYDSEKSILENKDDLENISLIQDKKVAVQKNIQRGKKQAKKKRLPQEEFENTAFEYIAEEDEFECPAGNRLKKNGSKKKDKNDREVFEYKCEDCQDCKYREKCTSSTSGRMLKVSAHASEIKEYKKWISSEENKKLLSRRKEMVEHPFGVLKRNWGFDYFMQRGIENVRAEFSFISFIYNLKRVINIVGVTQLIGRLAT